MELLEATIPLQAERDDGILDPRSDFPEPTKMLERCVSAWGGRESLVEGAKRVVICGDEERLRCQRRNGRPPHATGQRHIRLNELREVVADWIAHTGL